MRVVVVAGVRLLEGMFALGMAGSALVLVQTFVEDLETLFRNDPAPPATLTPHLAEK